MSTTKIFVIFGVIVGILDIPLVVMYILVPGVFGRYIGLVENIIVGTVGAFLVALALDFTMRRRQEKALEKVARVGLSEGSQFVNRMLDLFAGMIKASSDGFIPTTIEELFDTKAAELISLHLDLGGHAPTELNILWQDYLSVEAKILEEGLTSVHERYQAFLPEDSLVALGTLRNIPLLHIFQFLPNVVQGDARHGTKRPVLNIPLEDLKPIMEEIVGSVNIVQREAIRLNTKVMPRFPKRKFMTDIEPKLGNARFEGKPGPGLFIGPEPPVLS